MKAALVFGVSALVLAATAWSAQTQAPAAKRPAVTWSLPSSTVTPSKNLDLSAWNTHDSTPRKPSVDENLNDPALKGAIDLHAHFGPDSYERQWDAFEIAKIAQQRGMRGLVLKNHWSESAGLANLTRKYATPGLEVFGGLVLNAPEGGINPQAVRYFAAVEGHLGKVVWMPTHDSQHEVLSRGQVRPYVRVSTNGVLLPQVLEILDIIAENHMTLATGHVTDREMLLIVAEAKKRGITGIIITHPSLGPNYTDATVDELKQAIAMGAYVEIVASQMRRDGRDGVIAKMRAIGAEHCVVSSDSGLVGTPNHADALAIAARELRRAGFSERELDLMFKENPARALGLPVR